MFNCLGIVNLLTSIEASIQKPRDYEKRRFKIFTTNIILAKVTHYMLTFCYLKKYYPKFCFLYIEIRATISQCINIVIFEKKYFIF